MSEEIFGKEDLQKVRQVETDPKNVVQVKIPWDDGGDPEGGSPGFYDFWGPIMDATNKRIQKLINDGQTVQLVDRNGNIIGLTVPKQP